MLLANSQTAQLTARAAFRAAAQRSKKIVFADLCDKMTSAALRRRVTNLAASEFPEIALSHLPAAEAAARLIRSPGSMDVLLTDPLFGDLLFAQAAMTGTPNLRAPHTLATESRGSFIMPARFLNLMTKKMRFVLWR